MRGNIFLLGIVFTLLAACGVVWGADNSAVVAGLEQWAKDGQPSESSLQSIMQNLDISKDTDVKLFKDQVKAAGKSYSGGETAFLD